MIGLGWLKPLLDIVAGFIGIRRDTLNRKNSPEIIANEKAKDEVKSEDEINALITKAEQGDKKSLEELRKEASE